MFKEASTYITIISANVGWFLLLFLWHLWLAPYELVWADFKKVQRSPIQPITLPPAPRLVDTEIAGLAGKVRLMGEKYNVTTDGVFDLYHRELQNSAHPIWINEELNNLRTEFLDAIWLAKITPASLSNMKPHENVKRLASQLATRLLAAAEK